MAYRYIFLICFVWLLTACGGSTPGVASNVPPYESVTVEASVTATVMKADADTRAEEAPIASATPTEAAIVPPAETISVSTAPAVAVDTVTVATVAPATAVPEPATCMTVQGVNIRIGPGVSYNPALRTLSTAETLIPLAFQPSGYPDGQWVQVQVAATGEVGWVSASPQFISCNFSVNSLPPAANILPTPTAPPISNVQPPGNVLRPHVQEKATGGEVDFDPQMDFQHQYNDGFLLRLDIKNNHDQSDADVNGRGISKVTFQVTHESTGIPVYTHEEGTAGYCIFRGGEPDCRPWPQNGNGRYTWGEGGAEVEPGTYKINVFIYPKNPEFEGQSWFWGSTFTISP